MRERPAFTSLVTPITSTEESQMTSQRDALYPTEEGFVQPFPADELLHNDVPPDADFTLSETSYFGFNIPEAGIDCEIYAWFHPTLRVVSGGLMIFQGYKTVAGQADFLDYRNTMPYPDGDIDDVHYPTGVRIRVVEPLEHIEIQFESPDGQTKLDVTCRAIMPAAGRTDGRHFVQAMKCNGELLLRGERHVIDSYFTRDRSYLLPRAEVEHPVEPFSWAAGVFGDDLAFHVVGGDSEEMSPKAAHWGYIWRDGELRGLSQMRKKTLREADGIWPTSVEIDLVDSRGDTYEIRGTGRSLLPFPFWPNMITNLMFTRWELNGRVGHGDYQDIHFGHTLREIPSPVRG
ncbi:hypothetical protein ACIRON_16920 [Nocardioides sp. NPDC101246]|uniref:DUF7064 domain-containing protein n=1 Tax=Nocardioides sp. NPDC101246 TaxID=3364336 RepID=UPI00380D81A5